MKYIKNAIPVEAIQWVGTEDNLKEIRNLNSNFGVEVLDTSPRKIRVETLEGWQTGKLGDMIMKGIHNELYICDLEIFEKTYSIYSEAVEELPDLNEEEEFEESNKEWEFISDELEAISKAYEYLYKELKSVDIWFTIGVSEDEDTVVLNISLRHENGVKVTSEIPLSERAIDETDGLVDFVKYSVALIVKTL